MELRQITAYVLVVLKSLHLSVGCGSGGRGPNPVYPNTGGSNLCYQCKSGNIPTLVPLNVNIRDTHTCMTVPTASDRVPCDGPCLTIMVKNGNQGVSALRACSTVLNRGSSPRTQMGDYCESGEVHSFPMYQGQQSVSTGIHATMRYCTGNLCNKETVANADRMCSAAGAFQQPVLCPVCSSELGCITSCTGNWCVSFGGTVNNRQVDASTCSPINPYPGVDCLSNTWNLSTSPSGMPSVLTGDFCTSKNSAPISWKSNRFIGLLFVCHMAACLLLRML